MTGGTEFDAAPEEVRDRFVRETSPLQGEKSSTDTGASTDNGSTAISLSPPLYESISPS